MEVPSISRKLLRECPNGRHVGSTGQALPWRKMWETTGVCRKSATHSQASRGSAIAMARPGGQRVSRRHGLTGSLSLGGPMAHQCTERHCHGKYGWATVQKHEFATTSSLGISGFWSNLLADLTPGDSGSFHTGDIEPFTILGCIVCCQRNVGDIERLKAKQSRESI